jgi:hypothetical protein
MKRNCTMMTNHSNSFTTNVAEVQGEFVLPRLALLNSLCVVPQAANQPLEPEDAIDGEFTPPPQPHWEETDADSDAREEVMASVMAMA